MCRVKLTLTICLIVYIISMVSGNAVELYPSKYDHINVDLILSNPRLRTQYLNCYLDKGACITADARFIKDTFPEAFVTKCRRCTEKQKEFFEKITLWYTEHEPDIWQAIIRKTIKDIEKSH